VKFELTEETNRKIIAKQTIIDSLEIIDGFQIKVLEYCKMSVEEYVRGREEEGEYYHNIEGFKKELVPVWLLNKVENINYMYND
jgi:hypothetical protein